MIQSSGSGTLLKTKPKNKERRPVLGGVKHTTQLARGAGTRHDGLVDAVQRYTPVHVHPLVIPLPVTNKSPLT
jgi:hypothetical protein